MANDKRPRPQDILNLVSVRHRVIKQSPTYPEYEDGDDVDIFCVDRHEMGRQLVHLLLGRWDIRVTDDDHHLHVDIVTDGSLVVRFDLIDSLELYKEMILDGGGELGLRLLEWEKHPHKKHHLDYVKRNI